MVERTEFGQRLVFEVNVPDDMKVPLAAEDYTEIIGALIENAARHASRRVRISGSSSLGDSGLSIEDDGPGIAPVQISEAVTRGGRLDEVGSGHGMGLAIAYDRGEATRGQIALSRSDLGGLLVANSWTIPP